MYRIIGADQKQYGPISADQIRIWISEGRLNAASKIQIDGSNEWKTLAEFPEFSAAVPRPVAIAMPPPVSKTNGLAIASLVLGILSLPPCCSFVLAPLGIVLGGLSLAQLRQNPGQSGKELAIAGIVMSILGLIIYCAWLYWFVFVGGSDRLHQLLQNQ